MTSSLVAIAALLVRVSLDPLLVIYCANGGAEVIGVNNGIPYYKQIVPATASGEIDINMINHALDYGKQTMMREFNLAVGKVVCLGNSRDSLDLAGLNHDLLTPEWQDYDINPELAIDRPALAGLPFVDEGWSLLPKGYHGVWQLRKISLVASYFFVVAALILGFLSYQKYQENIALEQEVGQEYSTLAARINSFQDRLPAVRDVADLERHLDRLLDAENEPKLHSLLARISNSLPAQLYIANLELARPVVVEDKKKTAANYDQNSMAIEVASAELVEPGIFTLNLQIVTKANFAGARNRFDAAVMALVHDFQIIKADWRYDEESKIGQLYIDMQPLPRAKGQARGLEK